MIEKIKNIINREISEENEPKETAVLIRVLCLVDILFLSVCGTLNFCLYGPSVGVPSVSLILLLILVFWFSYHVSMNTLVYLYYVALAVNVIVLVLMTGLGFMYQGQFYILFLVFFYRAAGKPSERMCSIVISTVILVALVFYIRVNGSLVAIDMSKAHATTFVCCIYIMTKSGCIGHFFRKKFSASEEKIIRYSKRLEMLATTDPLTKLQNRRGMIQHIEEYTTEAATASGLLTIAIGDIDFFKHINDTYGHEAGDYVLETLAKIMNDFMDGKGMVARWGGEEFLFSLEKINGDYAFEEMSKLLHLIERYEFSYDGTPINVTMTFGLEEYDDNNGIDKVISRADEKLYMGKEQGRNRVIY